MYKAARELFELLLLFVPGQKNKRKLFLKKLHFLEGFFRFTVNIYYRTEKSVEDYVCSVSLVEVRSDKTQTLKGLLSNPHDFSSQRKTLMVFLCKSLKEIGV